MNNNSKLSPYNPAAPVVSPVWTLAIICAFMVISLPFPAHASTPMSEALCYILNMLQGKAGRGMGTIAILVVGVAAMMGKASWGMSITVAVGIGVIFSAVAIVYQLGLGLANCAPGETQEGANYLFQALLATFA